MKLCQPFFVKSEKMFQRVRVSGRGIPHFMLGKRVVEGPQLGQHVGQLVKLVVLIHGPRRYRQGSVTPTANRTARRLEPSVCEKRKEASSSGKFDNIWYTAIGCWGFLFGIGWYVSAQVACYATQ